MKGRKMLKSTAVLLMITAAVNIALCGFSLLRILLSGNIPVAQLSLSGDTLELRSVSVIVSYAVFSAFAIAAGIYGLQAAKLPTVFRIRKILVLGIACLVSSAVGGTLLILFSGLVPMGLATALCGVCLSILYIIGVSRFNKSLCYLLQGV